MADLIDGLGLPASRRQFLRRSAGAVLMAGSASSLLAACGGGGSTPAVKSAAEVGEISRAEIAELGWAIGSSIPTLDVAKNFVSATLSAATLTLEPLVVVDRDLKLAPWLATLDNSDPSKAVFTLREGVTFTDGTPLGTEDVVYSWKRHLDKRLGSQLSSYLGSVEDVRATGAREVTVGLSAPDPAFAYIALFVGIHSKAFGEKAGDKLGSPGTGVLGTGMYTITSYRPDQGVRAVRNERYWGRKPRAKKVNLRVITDPDTARLALQSGDVSGVFALPLAAARQYGATRGVQVVDAPNSTSTFLSFPVTEAPFDDVHVRRAVAHCIDNAALAKALLGGRGEPATSLSAPSQWAPLLGQRGARKFLAGLPAYPFSVAAAKAELAKSAHAGGFTASISVPSSDPELGKIALSLAQNLKQIGATLQVKQVSSDTYNTQLYTDKKPALWVARLNPVLADPTDYLGICLPSSGIPAGGFNFAGYRNTEVDRLLKEQSSSAAAERTKQLQQVATIAQQDLPYAPIYWPNYAIGVRKDTAFVGLDQYSDALPWAQDVGRSA